MGRQALWKDGRRPWRGWASHLRLGDCGMQAGTWEVGSR